MAIIKAPNPKINKFTLVLKINQNDTIKAITGITGPNGNLNARSASFIFFLNTITAIMVGINCANLEIALICAK